MNRKALGMLSGGLDSTLAVRIMLEMGIDVTAINFITPFCTCTSRNAGCKSEAVRVSKEFNIPIKVVFLGEEYIEMIKNPEYGYGKNMNPCLDCRIMMLERARRVMEESGASFIFTGEVLGQRPMSQRRDTMHLIERESRLKGLIVRPLSARLMKPTIPEIEGIIDRERLLEISGRSRKPQMRMAREYDIDTYPCPSGGCLLTERNFAKRMRDLIRYSSSPSIDDVRLLRLGRHFRVTDNCKAIVGRNMSENERLKTLIRPKDHSFIVSETNGPFTIARGELKEDTAELICRIVARYSDATNDSEVTVQYIKGMERENGIIIRTRAIDEERLREMMI